jgi:hypothetical protein
MTMITKSVAAVGIAGLMALAAAAPAEARHGRNAAAVGGFVAGAAVGAAVAGSSNRYYGGPGGYYGPTYYEPAPTYYGGYAYEPAPTYYAPAPRRCWIATDSTRGYGYYGRC